MALALFNPCSPCCGLNLCIYGETPYNLNFTDQICLPNTVGNFIGVSGGIAYLRFCGDESLTYEHTEFTTSSLPAIKTFTLTNNNSPTCTPFGPESIPSSLDIVFEENCTGCINQIMMCRNPSEIFVRITDYPSPIYDDIVPANWAILKSSNINQVGYPNSWSGEVTYTVGCTCTGILHISLSGTSALLDIGLTSTQRQILVGRNDTDYTITSLHMTPTSYGTPLQYNCINKYYWGENLLINTDASSTWCHNQSSVSLINLLLVDKDHRPGCKRHPPLSSNYKRELPITLHVSMDPKDIFGNSVSTCNCVTFSELNWNSIRHVWTGIMDSTCVSPNIHMNTLFYQDSLGTSTAAHDEWKFIIGSGTELYHGSASVTEIASICDPFKVDLTSFNGGLGYNNGFALYDRCVGFVSPVTSLFICDIGNPVYLNLDITE